MENKVWRVTLKYGYYNLEFDFDDSEEACNFIVTATKTFNRKQSEDSKNLYTSLSYVDKDEKVEDE